MSHPRPHGLGWGTGPSADPVEIQADPPGDGIGPDLTPPDEVPGMDAKEARRLQREHRDAVKATSETADPREEHRVESAFEEPTPNPFAGARADGPQDPQPEDPRVGKGDR